MSRVLVTVRGRPEVVLAAAGLPVAAASGFVAMVSVSGVRGAALTGLVLVAHAALVVRRSRPVRSFAIVCAAFAGQWAVTGLFLVLPSVVVFPISLYSGCAHGPRRVPSLSLATGVVAVVPVTWRLVTDPSVEAQGLAPNPFLVAALLLAVVVAAAGLGLYRRAQLAYVAVLEERGRHAEAEQAERARRAVMDERTRIAREMHDVVAHSLSVVVAQAKGGRYAGRADPDRAIEVLGTVEEVARQALADMRGLLGVLRVDDDADAGHGGAGRPQPGLAELPDLLDRVRATGLTVRHAEHGTPRQLGAMTELAVFRTVQEALTNTMRHAGRQAAADVVFEWSPRELVVSVSDTGGGPAGTSPGGGHGLVGMAERISAVGGSVSAGPRDGAGFVVSVRVPVTGGAS